MKSEMEGKVPFDTGNLSREEIESTFNALPVEVTFVDKDDTVRYYNQSKDRIFMRAKTVLGRSVQQCHPEKSVHMVNRILEDFKSGKRDVAEFWMNLEGKLIHIRYLPVRSKSGEYLGCLEVTQDITGIKRIEGEKRLL
jgi:PAS domain S-box-containing protein